jgi:hypothetical protein
MPLPTLAYPIRKKLYLNVTDRCRLRCALCPRHIDRPKVHHYELTLAARPAAADIVAAVGDPAAFRRRELGVVG